MGVTRTSTDGYTVITAYSQVLSLVVTDKRSQRSRDPHIAMRRGLYLHPGVDLVTLDWMP